MLNRFEYAGKNDKKIRNYKFWQDGNEAKPIYNFEFLKQKTDYIHNNPVKAEIVEYAEQYKFSSAINYLVEKDYLIQYWHGKRRITNPYSKWFGLQI